MVYELRIYHMHPGRQQAICDRFQNHTLGLFRNHGIKVTDFWVDAQGANRLYYICAFESEQAKAAAWAEFQKDEDWIRARTLSEQDGPIVERVESFLMECAPFFGDAAGA